MSEVQTILESQRIYYQNIVLRNNEDDSVNDIK